VVKQGMWGTSTNWYCGSYIKIRYSSSYYKDKIGMDRITRKNIPWKGSETNI
jgi:hypothetical protein